MEATNKNVWWCWRLGKSQCYTWMQSHVSINTDTDTMRARHSRRSVGICHYNTATIEHKLSGSCWEAAYNSQSFQRACYIGTLYPFQASERVLKLSATQKTIGTRSTWRLMLKNDDVVAKRKVLEFCGQNESNHAIGGQTILLLRKTGETKVCDTNSNYIGRRRALEMPTSTPLPGSL